MTVIDPSAAAVVAPLVTVPAAATPPPASVPNVGEPNWLPERIAQAKTNAAAEERANVFAELGVSNPEEAKTAIAAAKTAADANKTAETRAAELKAKLDGVSATVTAQNAVIAEMAGRQMGVLTPEQSAAVKAVAGDDAGAQLRAIAALQPTWAKPAVPAAPAVVVAPPAAPDTSPGRTAPNGGAGTSPPDQRGVYDQLQKQNPFAAAEHGLRHAGDVYKPRV